MIKYETMERSESKNHNKIPTAMDTGNNAIAVVMRVFMEFE